MREQETGEPEPPRLALKAKEAAQELGISERHLWRLLKRQEGPPTVRLGNRLVFRREALAAWLKEKEAA